MLLNPRAILAAAVAALPGWIFLIAGTAIVAAALLMPPWLEAQHLRWRKAVMQSQYEQLEQQQQRYAEFHQALLDREPLVLERLAITQLGLKPEGKQPLALNGPLDPATIEAWLERPLPRVGVDLPPPRQARTRLVRLTTGRFRPLLIVAGLAFALGGIWMRSEPDRGHAQSPASGGTASEGDKAAR
ncbi:MAG: hypothetical protein ACLFV3_02590 [Phycisphaeraceae bacterium]